MRFGRLAATAFAVASMASVGLAATGAMDPALGARGWMLFDDPRWRPAVFRLQDETTIAVRTDDSTALIYRPVEDTNRHKRYLSWRWRVEQPMPTTDISVKGGDDRPIAVHVWFEEPAGRFDLWQFVKSKTVETLFGIPVTGKVLTYVWGGHRPRGAAQANPHIGAGSRMIVLRPGNTPAGRWFTERVDLAGDFRRAFGYVPGAARILAIAGDAEDTHVASLALISGLRFAD